MFSEALQGFYPRIQELSKWGLFIAAHIPKGEDVARTDTDEGIEGIKSKQDWFPPKRNQLQVVQMFPNMIYTESILSISASAKDVLKTCE